MRSYKNTGILEELGNGAKLSKKSDLIVIPSNVADARCRDCKEGKTALCTGVNLGFSGGVYGKIGPFKPWCSVDNSLDMSPWDLMEEAKSSIRISYADSTTLILPPRKEHEAVFIVPADIPPTGMLFDDLDDHDSARRKERGLAKEGDIKGWHSVQVRTASTYLVPSLEPVAIFGAGSIGLVAAYSAAIRNASRVYVIDRVPEHLDTAARIDCTPLDASKGRRCGAD
ncbi:LOW QUALITY PROTEIN: Alcohol dehydrogenase GroES-like domain [Geosmithia morbida]|uniref:Alcohol dehydrogenase GroES-like domain n=1 Tax=Geosmithia morbida TaxID=1094350 RepID=A0A9P4YUW7_9HYPO|nr:LOW QUALITY PROTEIN: Alcohol dehydrogenase GroES-like domain [Geosmithia morbida]KAF4122229.1 LOW QUALITY PROTEIN: Alcohol dehydrogenase GroES-like domain [Geosmithia morbida]